MHQHIRRRSGFTLAELLVAIAIIVILLGILIPVVSRVRQASHEANTKSQLTQIAGAIERYFMDHRAYPGPVSNRDITTNFADNPGNRPVGPTEPITSTENLTLGLLGGLDRSGVSIVYDPTLVGRGPSSLNPMQPRRYSAYLDEAAGIGDPDPAFAATYSDSNIPEFVDRFPNPKAILYVRANTGASGTIRTDAGQPVRQYEHAHLLRYLSLDPLQDPLRDPNVALEYFAHPTLRSNPPDPAVDVPRGKDKFILISAGRDRRYGTEEDIVYPPN